MHRFTGFSPPRTPNAPPVSIRVSDTHDAEEQAACLTGWGQCYEQMSSGPFDGHFESYRFDGIELFSERANQVVQQYGQPQAGCMTVAAVQGSDNNGHFCGLPVKPGHYFFLRGGKDFHFRTPHKSELNAVSVDLHAFGEYCERVGELPPPGACVDNGLLPQHPGEDLNRMLQSLLNSLRHAPDMLDHPTLRRCLAESLHSILLNLCVPPETVGKDLTASCRQYVVNKARDYMNEHIDAPITVSELCAHIRVSRRTLQYAFQDVLGTNPARYLRTMRLNGARRDIRHQTDDQTSLADVAARWGFWHPSRFASEYKSLFGELPSQTLRAALSR